MSAEIVQFVPRQNPKRENVLVVEAFGVGLALTVGSCGNATLKADYLPEPHPEIEKDPA